MSVTQNTLKCTCIKRTRITWPLKGHSGAHPQHSVAMHSAVPEGTWSGSGPIPAINEEVTVEADNLGRAAVLGYAVSGSGYIGLIVKFRDPPARYQNRTRPGLVFGSELG